MHGNLIASINSCLSRLTCMYGCFLLLKGSSSYFLLSVPILKRFGLTVFCSRERALTVLDSDPFLLLELAKLQDAAPVQYPLHATLGYGRKTFELYSRYQDLAC